MNLNDEIAKVAYEIYEKSGYIKGRDFVNWLEAERIVLARRIRQEAEGRKETTVNEEPARKAGTAKKVTVKEKKKAPQKEPGKAARKATRKKEQ